MTTDGRYSRLQRHITVGGVDACRYVPYSKPLIDIAISIIDTDGDDPVAVVRRLSGSAGLPGQQHWISRRRDHAAPFASTALRRGRSGAQKTAGNAGCWNGTVLAKTWTNLSGHHNDGEIRHARDQQGPDLQSIPHQHAITARTRVADSRLHAAASAGWLGSGVGGDR